MKKLLLVLLLDGFFRPGPTLNFVKVSIPMEHTQDNRISLDTKDPCIQEKYPDYVLPRLAFNQSLKPYKVESI